MAASTLSIKLRCASWQQLATIYRRDLSRGSMFLKASTQPPVGTQVKIDLELPSATVLELIDRAGGQVDGIKLSVLDADREVALRRRLPAGVRLYTGDDFNYAPLIRGDADGSHSDALLGAFAAITAPAAAALAALDRGDLAGYDAAMEPTVPLSRLIFEPPTYHYKAGVAFLAWLNGLQPHFVMLDGLERQRPAGHLIRLFELAAAARALIEPELAAMRMGEMLARSAHPGPV